MNNIDFVTNSVSLFSGVNKLTVSEMLNNASATEKHFEKGDVICPANEINDCLIIILSGKAVIRKGNVEMRTLQSGDITGVSTLFGDMRAMKSEITSATKCNGLFINKNAVLFAIKSDNTLAENYIRFLSTRIQFLNSAIDRCTGADSVNKLARFLRDLYAENGNKFSFNMSLAASKMSVGRATVYRALDTLIADGIVTKENRTIIINDIEKLKKLYL